MKVQVIQVPYDSGHKNVRMGAGPSHFIQNGAAQLLQSCGYDVDVTGIEAETPFQAEIRTAFELCRLLARRVREAYALGVFPLVLSGNCNSSLGTLGGLDSSDLGMIWFDAHGDFNNPETRESSFFDGMGMSIATGHCWRKLAETIPGFHPLPGTNVVHVGGRDFDTEEWELLEHSGVQVVTAEAVRRAGIRGALAPVLEVLSGCAGGIHLHIDLDVLDPDETPANEYSLRAPGGMKVEQVEDAIQMIGTQFRICSSGIASYDPSYDPDGHTFRAGVRLMKAILAQAASNNGMHPTADTPVVKFQ